jgi:hypothetical protein
VLASRSSPWNVNGRMAEQTLDSLEMLTRSPAVLGCLAFLAFPEDGRGGTGNAG